jgi:hypothetical protein
LFYYIPIILSPLSNSTASVGNMHARRPARGRVCEPRHSSHLARRLVRACQSGLLRVIHGRLASCRDTRLPPSRPLSLDPRRAPAPSAPPSPDPQPHCHLFHLPASHAAPDVPINQPRRCAPTLRLCAERAPLHSGAGNEEVCLGGARKHLEEASQMDSAEEASRKQAPDRYFC